FRRGLFEAGRVDDAEGEITEPRPPFAAVARDSGEGVDQCEALADEAIEQRRLADIRPADNGDREAHERRSVVEAALCPSMAREATQRVGGGSGQATPLDCCPPGHAVAGFDCMGGGSGHWTCWDCGCACGCGCAWASTLS